MMRTIFAVSLVLAFAVTIAAGVEPKATLTTGEEPELAGGPAPTVPVLVTNFPVDVDGNLRVVEQSTRPKQVEVVNFPASPPNFRLVGFTSATVGTTSGLFALVRACQIEFPGTRVCQLDEVLATTNIPDLSSAGTPEAWLMKSFTDPPPSEDCWGWTWDTGSRSAWAVTTRGSYYLLPCGLQRSVACCGQMR